ncbi:polysaccharide pyruvyl transferase CsaB [soil metagenome]
MARSLVLISGYYGFDNLGDEAILEQLLSEVKAANVDHNNIVVLSNQPELTSKQFSVRSVNRWNLKEILSLMPQTKLFISGGGGLFQDTQSIKSIIYYGGLLAAARALGSKVLIYAQGIGPLKKAISKNLTKQSWQLAQQISVRDENSYQQLVYWGLAKKSIKTADPVWALKPSTLPEAVREILANASSDKKNMPALVGISLRTGASFSDRHCQELVKILEDNLDSSTILVMLPLQDEQDRPILKVFAEHWQSKERIVWLPPNLNLLPSQWLSLIASLDMVIGMRLHSLIMSLASNKPVIGISYDPKVEIVLQQFKQPNLSFSKSETSPNVESWTTTVIAALRNYSELSAIAKVQAEESRKIACQNGALIAKILTS